MALACSRLASRRVALSSPTQAQRTATAAVRLTMPGLVMPNIRKVIAHHGANGFPVAVMLKRKDLILQQAIAMALV